MLLFVDRFRLSTTRASKVSFATWMRKKKINNNNVATHSCSNLQFTWPKTGTHYFGCNSSVLGRWQEHPFSWWNACMYVYISDISVVGRGKESDKTLTSYVSKKNNFCKSWIRWISPPLSEHMYTAINFLISPTCSCCLWRLLSFLCADKTRKVHL